MSDDTPIRIVLIDDHALFRSGIRLLLGRHPEFEIVGEAGDAVEGVNRVRQSRPDVVLLDLHMPGMSGCEAAGLIAREVPGTQVLMLTVSEDGEDLFATLKAGASGYLLKNIEADALVAAIQRAADGESVISPRMMDKLLAGVREGDASHPRAEPQAAADAPVAGDVAGLERLTPREREILLCIARGLSNKEIARELDVAESTVKIHVQNMLRKLQLASRVQAAVFAVEQGLLPERD